jgi:hypothetical protein
MPFMVLGEMGRRNEIVSCVGGIYYVFSVAFS